MEEKRFTRARVIQSALAGLYILIVFYGAHLFQREMTAAPIAASAFIVFSFPHADSSRFRALVGGYCVGAVSGLLFGVILVLFQYYSLFPAAYIPACAGAVFLAMLLMTVLDFKHPPAAAFAVAVTLYSHRVILSIAGIFSIWVLCAFKELFKARMRDL